MSSRRGFGRDTRGQTTRDLVLGLLVVVVAGAAGVGLVEASAGTIVGAILLAIAVVAVDSAVVIVNAYEKRALVVLGEYRKLLDPGINFVPPFVSRTIPFDLRTQTVDVPRQEAITEDNSPVVANAVLYVRVMDAKKAFLEVEDYTNAVSNLAQTTLRAVLGDMQLDDTLSKRRLINERIREELAAPTDEWGVRVESVEVQEITPSRDVVSAMEQQTSAERRRRAMILEAQGKRRSDIERAQGDKQFDIITAQGEKQAQILEAQGSAISTVLRSRSAEAMGERAIIDKGFDTLAGIGQGDSTTYVLPQEVSSTLGRYGKHLTGGVDDDGDGEQLEGKEFSAEDREMLGLDDIEEIIGNGQDDTTDVDPSFGGGDGRGDGERVGGGPAGAESGDRRASASDAVPDPEGVTDTVEGASDELQSAVEDATSEAERAMPDPEDVVEGDESDFGADDLGGGSDADEDPGDGGSTGDDGGSGSGGGSDDETNA